MLGICSYVPEWTKSESKTMEILKYAHIFLERFLNQFQRFLNKLYKHVTSLIHIMSQ